VKQKAVVHVKLVKNEVEHWIYAQNFEVKVDLDNKYAKLKKDT
jgi:hypothetical protein